MFDTRQTGERRSIWDNIGRLSPMYDYPSARVAPADTSTTELVPASTRVSQVQPQYRYADNQVLPYQPNRPQQWTTASYPSTPPTAPPAQNVSAPAPSRKFLIIASVIGVIIDLCITGIPMGILTTSYLQLKFQGSSSSGQTYPESSVILPSQCSAYTNISDATRLTTCTGAVYTDCSWVAGWYRITGGAGTRLIMMPASTSYCCTSYPGWFNGTLPTTTGDSTVGMYCVHYNGYICYSPWSLSTIPVTNCGDYYIYFLPAMTSCNSRYCTAP